jgi:hypothetical protein
LLNHPNIGCGALLRCKSAGDGQAGAEPVALWRLRLTRGMMRACCGPAHADEEAAQGLRALLRKLCSGRVVTVLFVTHNTMEAVALATRVVRLSGAPATIVQDVTVALPEEQRKSADAVAAEHARIFGHNG